MELTSLAWRTDLALLGYSGSQVVDRGDHLVVSTPTNPTYHWGNFLLLAEPPGKDDLDRWLETYERELPHARHRTFGVDGRARTLDDLEAFRVAGFDTDANAVLTADAVHAPPRPNPSAELRPLLSDADWEQQVALGLAGEDVSEAYVTAKAQAHRRLVEQGRGQWFGAFLDGRLMSSMGIFVASEGLARFQEVKTHPDARGQGLCGTLVEVAGRYGLQKLGARTLVMVADPGYLAIRVYRSVGFAETETQLQASRIPPKG